jgi:hypothetical protein
LRDNPQSILAINALQFVRAEFTLLQALKMLRRTCAKRIVNAEYNLRRADDSFQTLHLYRIRRLRRAVVETAEMMATRLFQPI